jgi:hypothetical protein
MAGMATVLWGAETAAVYEAACADMFAPAVLGPAVDVLAALAGGGPRWSSPPGRAAWHHAGQWRRSSAP